MAGYLAAQFPGDYYGGDEAKSLDFIGYFDNQRQKESARRNQEINRQMALDEMFAAEQERPLNLQRKSLDNQGLEALLPQKQAQGKMAQREWEVEEGVPVEQRRKAMLGKLAREMTEDDLKSTQAAIEAALVHPSPAVRAQAAQLRGLMSDMQKLQRASDTKIDVAETAAAAKRAAAQEVTARQQTAIAARAAQQRDTAARTPRGYQEAATRYRILAEEADDPATKIKYLELAAEFEAAAQTQAKASKAGQTTITPEGGLGVIEAKPQLGPRNKPMSYAAPENVKEAFKAGKLSREDAAKILREQFGMK